MANEEKKSEPIKIWTSESLLLELTLPGVRRRQEALRLHHPRPRAPRLGPSSPAGGRATRGEPGRI